MQTALELPPSASTTTSFGNAVAHQASGFAMTPGVAPAGSPPTQAAGADERRSAGPALLRVGVPLVGGKLVRAARRAGYPVLFSANAFMVRDRDRDVVRVRKPDPEQFAGLDAALDSAGYVAMAKYNGFPWSMSQYLDLVASWPWTWYASMDQCVEPEIAGSKIDLMFRLAETCRLYAELRRAARDRGLQDPMPIIQGWEVGHYRWCIDHMPLFEWPSMVGVGSMCRRGVSGPRGVLAIVEALDRVLPPGVGLHLFGVKGNALRHLSGHPRVVSVDSMAWDFACRREAPTGRTSERRILAMHKWTRCNLERLDLPMVPYDRHLFDDPASPASQDLEEWLDLVASNEVDATSAWHYCIRHWIGE